MNRQSVLADFAINLNVYKCRYGPCVSPVNPNSKLPLTKRPSTVFYWSNLTTWTSFQKTAPQANESVLIPEGKYVIVDCVLPRLNVLRIDGYLELDQSMDHKLQANIIFINGGQLIIGWETNPMLTNVEIVLTGNKASADYKLPNELPSVIGNKAIGVYGGLDIHGKPRNISWTRLNQTVQVNDTQMTLIDCVDWQTGEQIIITTTSYIGNQSEVLTITNVSTDCRTLRFTPGLRFKHLAYREVLHTGEEYYVAAGVGLLTRNVKIIGEEYENIEEEMYGFRMIVSDYSKIVNGVQMYYRGYARISNVEMYHPGQFGALTGDDSRYGILFSNLGTYNASKPSYVRNSSMHHGYSCAIAIFKCAGIPIEFNVIYRTVYYGLRIEGNSNIIRNNLVMMNFWSASLVPSMALYDRTYLGTIDLLNAASVVLEDNFVAGSDRIGVYFRGDMCANDTIDPGFNHSIKRNTVYASMQGVVILPIWTSLSLFKLNCTRVSGFTVFKSLHWGIYYESYGSLIVEENVLIENKVGLFSMVVEPNPIEHKAENKTSILRRSLVIGQSPTFDCKTDVPPTKDLNYFYSSMFASSYGAGLGYDAKIGLVWSNFMGGVNKAPLEPW